MYGGRGVAGRAHYHNLRAIIIADDGYVPSLVPVAECHVVEEQEVCLYAPHQERRVCGVVGSSGRDKTQNRISDPADAMWGGTLAPPYPCTFNVMCTHIG